MLINRLTNYLLKSGSTIRMTYFTLFFISIYFIIANIETAQHQTNDIDKEHYKINTGNVVREIANLFEKYNITNKCKKIICQNKELKDKTIYHKLDSKNNKIHFLNIKCNGLSCYDFLRELENINLVFILQAKSFNIELLEKETLEWKNDMLITFEIDNL